jgi:hypothetical protein
VSTSSAGIIVLDFNLQKGTRHGNGWNAVRLLVARYATLLVCAKAGWSYQPNTNPFFPSPRRVMCQIFGAIGAELFQGTKYAKTACCYELLMVHLALVPFDFVCQHGTLLLAGMRQEMENF